MRKTLLLLACLAAPALGQRPVTLGDRVRVFAPRAGYQRLTGDVVSTTPDALSIRVERSPTEVAIPRDQIQRLYLSVATRRNTARGALMGAALGAGISVWFGPRSASEAAPNVESGSLSKMNVVSGTAIGAGFGALIGYFARSDSWIAVNPAWRAP